MKTWRNRFVLMAISLLFGGMMGVQLMSEHAGLSEPKPLSISEPTVKDGGREAPPSPSEKKSAPLTTSREEEGMSNFFSDLGSTVATGVEKVTRSGLEGLMGAVRNGINKENDRHGDQAESSY